MRFRGKISTMKPEKGRTINIAIAYEASTIPVLVCGTPICSVIYKGIDGINKLNEQAIKKLAIQTFK